MLGKLNGHMKSVKLESFLCHIPNVLTGLNLRTKTVKWASLVDQLVKNLPAVWETCIPKRLPGRPDEALGGGNQGPSAPAWARQHHRRQRDPPFVPRKRLPDWASPELSPSVESCGCGLGPSPVRLG